MYSIIDAICVFEGQGLIKTDFFVHKLVGYQRQEKVAWSKEEKFLFPPPDYAPACNHAIKITDADTNTPALRLSTFLIHTTRSGHSTETGVAQENLRHSLKFTCKK